jgi:hypothetical protein
MSDSASKLVCNVPLKSRVRSPHLQPQAARVYELRLLLEGPEEHRLPIALSQLHAKFTPTFFYADGNYVCKVWFVLCEIPL